MLLKLDFFKDKKFDVRDESKKNNDNSNYCLVNNKLQSKMSEALYEKKLVIQLNY